MQFPRRAALALALVWMLPCARAHAEVSASFAPFDPEQVPVGLASCQTMLTIVFSGQTVHPDGTSLLVDVWWAADDTVDCADSPTRASGACTHVDLDPRASLATLHGVTLTVSTSQLFADRPEACDAGSMVARTFFFFDAPAQNDRVTTFDTTSFVSRRFTIDAAAPTAPTLDGDAVGNTAITLGWIPPSSDPVPSSVRFYLDATGCPRTGVPESMHLLPGSAAPRSALVYGDDAPSQDGTTTFDTLDLGWPAGRYGQTGVLAMTAVDAAGNEGPLSNLICVYHTPCGGEDGGASPDCAPSSGCAIRRARSHGLAVPMALLGLLGYEIARRWKRFSSSRA